MKRHALPKMAYTTCKTKERRTPKRSTNFADTCTNKLEKTLKATSLSYYVVVLKVIYPLLQNLRFYDIVVISSSSILGKKKKLKRVK